MKKQIMALILSFALIISAFSVVGMTASAEKTADGNWEYYLNYDGTVTINKYLGNQKDLVYPSTIDGHKVTEISGSVEKWQSITSVVIPYGVESIGNNAFERLHDLESITIPDSVTSIGSEAFSCTPRLNNITISKNITSIGKDAFFNTGYYRKDENWTNGVLYIGNYLVATKRYEVFETTDYGTVNGQDVFYYCYTKSDVIDEVKGDYTIKAGTKAIADGAFYDCDLLTGITIPGTVKTISREAFSGSALKTLTIEEGVTKICDDAFSGTPLVNVTIPGTVKTVGNDVFSDCIKLKTVTFQEGVTEIGNHINYQQYYNDVMDVCNFGLFFRCDALESVYLPNTLTYIGAHSFYGCKKLKNLTIPSSVTRIGYEAFYDSYIYSNDANWINGILTYDNCILYGQRVLYKSYSHYNKTIISETSGDFTVPSNIRVIADYAFEHCDKITSVTIPSTIKSIPEGAFYKCNYISNININEGVQSIENSAFIGSNNAIVYIPKSVTSIGVDKIIFNDCMTTSYPMFSSFSKCNTDFPVRVCNTFVNVSEGSYAEKYCKENDGVEIEGGIYSIKYTHYDSLIGDANGDGKINSVDILVIKKYIVHINIKIDISFSDVNFDGKIDARDILLLKKYIVGIIKKF